MSDASPQVVYDNVLPEVHRNTKNANKERTSSQHTPKPWLKLILMITASVVAVAIAIGVGIGIWRRRKHGLRGSSTITRQGLLTELLPL